MKMFLTSDGKLINPHNVNYVERYHGDCIYTVIFGFSDTHCTVYLVSEREMDSEFDRFIEFCEDME